MTEKVEMVISSEAGIKQATREMYKMLADGWYRFEIKRGHRSLSQNALYWMWIDEIRDFINHKNKTDFKSEEIHIRMRHDFLGYDEPMKVGSTEVGARLKSTRKLTSGEFYHYMEQIQAHWAQFGLLLPVPADCAFELNRKRQNA